MIDIGTGTLEGIEPDGTELINNFSEGLVSRQTSEGVVHMISQLHP